MPRRHTPRGGRFAASIWHGPTTRTRCSTRFERDLDLPDWFGRNWDALADCLADVEQDARGLLVVLDHAAKAAERAPHDWTQLIDVFSDEILIRSETAPMAIVCVAH